MRAGAVWGLVVGVGSVLAAGVVVQPAWTVIAVGCALTGAGVLIYPKVVVGAAIVASFVVVPTVIPQPRLAVPLLIAALGAVMLHRWGQVPARPVAVGMGVAVAVGALVGLAVGTPLGWWMFEVQGPVATFAAFLVGVAVLSRPELTRFAGRVLCVTLWVSVAVMIAANVTGLSVVGAVRAAELSTEALGATRFQTAATHVGLAVCCAAVGFVISGRAWRPMLPLLAPAAVIVVLGFSRNAVLALAVAVLYAVFARKTRGALRAAVKVGAGVGFAVAVVWAGSFLIPGGASIRAQYTVFQERVIGGLFGDARDTDISVQYRRDENDNLYDAIRDAPLFGHGFGYAYRDGTGPVDSFTNTTGRYYAHNAYLWLTAKAGLIGVVAFFGPILWILGRGLRRGVTEGAAAAGLLAANLFAPMLESPSQGGAAALGASLALAVVAQRSALTEVQPEQCDVVRSERVAGR